MNVYQKLNAARMRFHQSKLTKSGHNKFANYKYFELADFLVPALNIFNDLGLFASVSFDQNLATMTIINVDVPEEHVVITSPLSSASLKGCHEVQNVGACETYARRYLWVAALEIVEHDALDSVTGSPAGEPTPKSKGTFEDKAIREEINGWKADMKACESLEELRTVTSAAIEWAKDNATNAEVALLKSHGLTVSTKFNNKE